MHHPWPPPSLRLLLPFLLSLFLSSLPPSFSDDSYLQLYEACSTRQFPCGSRNISFSYPFRQAESPPECGYLDTELSCNTTDDTLTIHIGKKQYRVKDNNIDYANYLVTVVDRDFVGNPCPRPSENTTLGSAPFQYAGDDVNATFFIDCPPSLPSPLVNIDCLRDYTAGWWSYYWPGNRNLSDEVYMCRRSFVQVPMNPTAIEQWIHGETNFAQALQEGFTLSWPAVIGDWCSACNSSGGVCGYDSSKPTCFCSDGPATDGSCDKVKGITTGHDVDQAKIVREQKMACFTRKVERPLQLRTFYGSQPLRNTSLFDDQIVAMHYLYPYPHWPTVIFQRGPSFVGRNHCSPLTPTDYKISNLIFYLRCVRNL